MSPFKTSDKIQKAIRKIPLSKLEDFYDTLWELAKTHMVPITPKGHTLRDQFERAVELGRQANTQEIWEIDTGTQYYAYFIGTEDEVIATLKDIGLPEIS